MSAESRWIARAAAVGLTLASVRLLMSLAPSDAARPPYLLGRALAVSALLHVGLFWAPGARGWGGCARRCSWFPPF